MKKINIYFIVFALAIVCLPALLSFGIRYLPANNQPPLGVTQKLYGDKIMKDRIGLSENNFSGLGLSFKNPNLINKKEITLEISEENGELLRSSVLSGFNIPDGGFVRFAFEPIADSKGNGYVIALSSPSSEEKEALEVYLSKGSENIALVAYYKPRSAASLIGDIYSNWMERLFQDKAFAALYLVIIVSGLGYVAFGKKETI